MFKLLVIHCGRTVHEETLRMPFTRACNYIDDYCLTDADEIVSRAIDEIGHTYVVTALWKHDTQRTYYLLCPAYQD